MGLLAQIYAWEALISILLILTSLYFFISVGSLKESKEEFNTVILSRDLLETLDNLNLTYKVFSNHSKLEEISNKLNIPEYFVPFFSTKNLIKNTIFVASNCSEEEIRKFNSWFKDLIINKRHINIVFLSSSIENVPTHSDLLLICGYKDLSNYENNLLSLIKKDKGILGFFDVNLIMDDTTKRLFGIDSVSYAAPQIDVEINRPSSIFQDLYYGYKYFYGVGIPINFKGINSTSGNFIGNFTFRNYTIPFEIDSEKREVYFYSTDIIKVKEGDKFNLYGYEFKLSYLENTTIYVSFEKTYNFTKFIEGGILPTLLEYDESKILLYQGYYNFRKVPVAILNGSKVAWVSNFDRYGNATDDKKLVLLSLILAVSDKNYNYGKISKNLVLIPFIDVEKYDIFEAYSIKFGYGVAY
ncbi:MAG: hypothetical protein QXW01_01945 [Candidatus Aenigmatarchaeota archaeon]